jgi:hypothetical protein
MRSHRRPLPLLAQCLAATLLLLAGAAPAAAHYGGCCATGANLCKNALPADCPTPNRYVCSKFCSAEGTVCTSGQIEYICVGGTVPGEECRTDRDCFGGTCTAKLYRCKGGNDDGKPCVPGTGACPGGSCDRDGNAAAVREVAAPSFLGAESTAAVCTDGSCAVCAVRPTCKLTAILAGPPAQIVITVKSSGTGLGHILVVQSNNADVPIPPFSLGTTAPVAVTATKIDQTHASEVTLSVEDLSGNVVLCDPVLAEVVRGLGKAKATSYPNLDAAEHVLTVENGRPGLDNLQVQVNGMDFVMARLQPGEKRSLDMARAMLPGGHNIVTLKSNGRPGTSASVVLWDGGGQ